MKVLYVESDSERARCVLQAIGECAMPMDADAVSTVEEALVRLGDASSYDVVLLALELTDGSGLDVVSHLRAQTSPAAIVAVLGEQDRGSLAAFLRAGIDEYFIDRGDFSRLSETMTVALERRCAAVSKAAEPLRVLYAAPSGEVETALRRYLEQHARHIGLETVRTVGELLRRLPVSPAEFEAGELPDVPDAVLLGASLSEADRFDVLREVASVRRIGVPVLLFIAPNEEAAAVQAMRFGAADYLTETSEDPHRLVVSVEIACRAARMVRERNDRERVLRELEECNKELEGVIYIASHDLRSPLVNIVGFSDRLGMACDDLTARLAALEIPEEARLAIDAILRDQIPASLRFVEAGVHKLDKLISGLLRVSRAGRAELQIQDIDMNRLVGSILESLSYPIQKGDVHVETESLPACRGDYAQVTQIMTAVIDNATKYRDLNRPLGVRIGGREEGMECIYVVEDTGRGIPPNQQRKIWQLFCRLDPQGPVPGEGLGLTVARRMLDRNRGRMWVGSEVGRGSRFFIALPKARAVPAAPAAPPASPVVVLGGGIGGASHVASS